MKILIIFTFFLISGPVDCSDVIVYSGGSVIIFSNMQWYAHVSKYICKVKGKGCTDIIRDATKRRRVQNGRFKLYSNTKKNFTVLIRKLKPQDAGTYRFGLGDQSNCTVNLKVLNDPCCVGPKLKTAYLGQNITITCKYPVVYKGNYKFVKRLNDDNNLEPTEDVKTKLQNSKFSVSDDRNAAFLILSISNVSKADEGMYLFGVKKSKGSVRYNSYFTEIQLHVTDTYMMPSEALTETGLYVIISVCVGVSLLLFGGFALMIYKLKCKTTQGSTPSSRRQLKVNNKAHLDKMNHLAGLPLYENRTQDLDLSTNQTDSIYECLNPETQVNTVYGTVQSY